MLDDRSLRGSLLDLQRVLRFTSSVNNPGWYRDPRRERFVFRSTRDQFFLNSSNENHCRSSAKCPTGSRSKNRSCCCTRAASNFRLISTRIFSPSRQGNEALKEEKTIS